MEFECYYDMSTKNISFVEVYNKLKDQGIENNKFFLLLKDRNLAQVDPYDKDLHGDVKIRIYRECCGNYWYFVREIVKVPFKEHFLPYCLTEYSTQVNFAMINNLNIITDTTCNISVTIRLLWEFLFGNTRGQVMLFDKKHKDSMNTLAVIKAIYHHMPDYLKIGGDSIITKLKNNIMKVRDSQETFENPINNNVLRALPSAKRKNTAVSLGRGCTGGRLFFRNFINMEFSNVILEAAGPAHSVVKENCRRDAAPYGIILSSDLSSVVMDNVSDEENAFLNIQKRAIKFDNTFYDKDRKDVKELAKSNGTFVDIHLEIL